MSEKLVKKGDRVVKTEANISTSSSWLPMIFMNIAMVVVGILISRYLPVPAQRDSYELNVKTSLEGGADRLLGMKGALLFNSLDTNRDDQISSHEFGPIVEKLTGEAPPVVIHQRADARTGDAVTLFTGFQPLVFETMKTYEDEGLEGIMRNFKAMSGLRAWTKAHQTESSFYSRDFHTFLPKTGDEIPGQVYWLYKPHVEAWYHANSGKYFPPNPDVREEILYRLMRMFHPRPFLFTRFGPHGSTAVVQASNDDYYLIRFRINCEFQVNEPPNLPFWVTPAQFTGSLVISKDGLRLKQFRLDLPSDRLLNVDMEWITKLANEEAGESEQMEVEIAYQPKMSIYTISNDAGDIEKYKWTKMITEQEAVSRLEKSLYPFKEVTYYPFNESFSQAAAEDKLVHTIVLWGSLDDQSC